MEKIKDTFWLVVAFFWLMFGRQSPDEEEGDGWAGEEPVPTTARSECPFYGFEGMPMMRVMLDNKGNACALTGEHSPCSMEMSGQKPCWGSCTHWNRPANHVAIGKMLQRTQVFPDEVKDKNGVPAHEWFKRITGRSFP